MKVLQVIPFLSLAGAETMCESLTYALRDAGHEVIVVSLRSEHTPITERLERAGVSIRYLDKRPGLDLRMFGRLRRLFRELSPDVVHAHLNTFKYVAPAARRARIPRVVYTVHNLAERDASPLEARLYGHAFRKWGMLPVALSERIADSVAALYRIPRGEISVIGNGIDLCACIPKRDYSAHTPFRILHVGRFNEQKNHLVLIEGFRLFHASVPQSELHLVGDGPLRAACEDFVRASGLTDAVIFHGVKSTVYDLMSDADIFTLPSVYEGLPMTLIEAMGTGLPIAASAVGGVPDMLEDGVSAILFPPGAEAVADAFARYHASPALREEHGRAALAASPAFSSRQMAARYAEVYQMGGSCGTVAVS